MDDERTSGARRIAISNALLNSIRYGRYGTRRIMGPNGRANIEILFPHLHRSQESKAYPEVVIEVYIMRYILYYCAILLYNTSHYGRYVWPLRPNLYRIYRGGGWDALLRTDLPIENLLRSQLEWIKGPLWDLLTYIKISKRMGRNDFANTEYCVFSLFGHSRCAKIAILERNGGVFRG